MYPPTSPTADLGGEPTLVTAMPPAAASSTITWQSFLRDTFGSRTWRATAFALIGFPIGVAGFVFLVTTTALSGGLAVTLVGIPLLAIVLTIERYAAQGYRTLGRVLLDVDLPEPPAAAPSTGPVAWIRTTLTDAVNWRSWLYVLVRFPLAIASFVVAVTAWSMAIATVTYPAWFWAVRYTDNDHVHHGGQLGPHNYADTPGMVLLVFVFGLVALLLAPWLVRAMAVVERALMRGLLGPTAADERVQRLEATRAAAVDTSAASIRRIERDLHDGTQAQLVALAMKLGLAKDELEHASTPEDLERVREMVDAAHGSAKDAIGDLRDLVRGIHPPALDVGLDAALATLVARCAVPTTLHVDLTTRPSPAIESIAYYSVAELLTNVSRHSAATSASVTVTSHPLRMVSDTVRNAAERVVVTVVDDGTGGAAVLPGASGSGSGLAGLQDRAATVDGTVTVVSPAGGPTVVTVDLPLHA